MDSSFKAMAVSRKDGSPQDGIHLLWTAPLRAGYSVHGYDIQRRVSTSGVEQDCHRFTADDFKVLNNNLRQRFSFGRIAVREAPCPSFPTEVPDEPFKADLPKVCINFQQMPVATFPNPRIIGGVQFSVCGKNYRLLRQTQQVSWGAFQGLSGGYRTNIELPTVVTELSLTYVVLAKTGTISIFDSNKKRLETRSMHERRGEPETLTFRSDDIRFIQLEAPENELLILELCYPPQELDCVDFKKFQLGPYSNPLDHAGIQFRVFNQKKVCIKHNEISSWKEYQGLNCAYQTQVRLPLPADEVSLELIHYAQSPKIIAYGTDGTPIKTSSSPFKVGILKQLTLKGDRPIQHIEIIAPKGETLLLSLCPYRCQEEERDPNEEWKAILSDFKVTNDNLTSSAAMTHFALSTHQRVCLAYTIDFERQHQIVDITTNANAQMAIAFSEGKAVATWRAQNSNNVRQFAFLNKSVDRVIIYTIGAIRSLLICVDIQASEGQEEGIWNGVPYLAQKIQLPLKNVNPNLTSDNDEDNLAQSRLLADESFDANSFRELAELMNEAAVIPDDTSPVHFTTRMKDQEEDNFIDVSSWSYAVAAFTDPRVRRMLGFGFFDDGQQLLSGASYDYRITAYFRRRDLVEQLFAFHTIPIETLLPRSFYLGPIHCFTTQALRVETMPKVPDTELRGTVRKGIALQPGVGGVALQLRFPTAVQQIAFEWEPLSSHNLTFEAKTSDYFFGLSGSIFSGPIPNDRRVVLNFSDPVDKITLKGRGFLYGIRFNPDESLASPDDIIRQTQIIRGVQYVATPAPTPPLFLGTQNLQTEIGGTPTEVETAPPQNMGFKLNWLPPPPSGSAIIPWPEDLGAFPPFDMVGFHLERRREDVSGSFESLGEDALKTMYMGSRSASQQGTQLSYGSDLLLVFPERKKPNPPIDLWMNAEDLLLSAATKIGEPGALYQYRIFSVDVIGRRSATAAVGSIVRLEKRIPPPRPVGPTTIVPDNVIRPPGVTARFLQASDPELNMASRTLLGGSTNAIVIEWGWTDKERLADPYAREFRLYWQPTIPRDRIEGKLVGSITTSLLHFEVNAQLNQAITADVLKGYYIRAGRYPFKVKTNTAGQNITIQLERSEIDSSRTPELSVFALTQEVSGAAMRPPAWDERVNVIPITTEENYQFILRDQLALNTDNPLAYCWIGVSTADDQYYRTDELPAVQPNGGRAGNESSIAAVSLQARFIGRPTFVVPPPLAAVPELLTNEPVGDTIGLELALASIFSSNPVTIPAGHRVIVERIPSPELLNRIAATDDNRIRATMPDRSSSTYQLANPTDQTNFLAQIRSGNGASVEGRFLMDFVIRFKDQLHTLWDKVTPTPVSFGTVKEVLSADPERYIYQIRLVDRAGHVSEEGALLPVIIRVRSTRVPTGPTIIVNSSTDNNLQVEAEVYETFDLQRLIVFAHTLDIGDPLDATTLEKAQLLRLPNRLDLYPDDGLRLRLKGGTVIAPTAHALTNTGTLELPLRKLTIPLTLDFDKRVAIWCVSMTRDGIPSLSIGPTVVTTGPAPLSAPIINAINTADEDTINWPALTVGRQVALERKAGGSADWQRVSPWLPATKTSITIPALQGQRRYRLVLKGHRNQETRTNEILLN